MIGEQVGSYIIEGELGMGGMGAVYRARHATLGRAAAVKVLLPQFSATPDIVQRFFNEAKAATSIRHLGIVEIYDFGLMDSGVAFIAMELLLGESLAARLKKRRMSTQASLATIRQMCGALAAAHDLGIVHRDLKPDNVFIVPDGEVASGERIKLLDFGIAKLSQDNSGLQSQTRTGSVMGTPAYMAPEQCRGVKVDHRADIYSLGCMLYEMAEGHPPHRGEGVGDILAAHIYAKHVPLDTAAPSTPVHVARLVDRLLAKDPNDRPQTARAVIDEIDNLPRAASIPSRPVAVIGAASTMASDNFGTDQTMLPPSAVATVAPTPLAATVAPSGPALPVAAISSIPTGKRGRGVVVSVGGVVIVAGAALAIAMSQRGAATPAAKPVAAAPAVAVTDAPIAPLLDAMRAQHVDVVHVRIDSLPSAHVMQDGRELGMTPYDTDVTKSDTAISFQIELGGYTKQNIDVVPNRDFEKRVELTRQRSAPHSHTPPLPPAAAIAPPPVAGKQAKPKPASNDDDETYNIPDPSKK